MRWWTEVSQLDVTMSISTNTYITQDDHSRMLSVKNIMIKRTNSNLLQSGTLLHFLQLRLRCSGCTDTDADPMQLAAPMTHRERHGEWFQSFLSNNPPQCDTQTRPNNDEPPLGARYLMMSLQLVKKSCMIIIMIQCHWWFKWSNTLNVMMIWRKKEAQETS